jgi:hypothetical protein
MSALKMFNTKFHSAFGDGPADAPTIVAPPIPKTNLTKAAEFVDKYNVDKIIIIVAIVAVIAKSGVLSMLKGK